ncbi:GNAT family N-acetyltransferase [Methanoculleus oceani]|nr:GNAT family N-acetyltransferase [Methanoculleus sp. CWC-02]
MMVRNWDKIPGGYVTTIDPAALPEVLRIYNDFCGCGSNGLFGRYSEIFNQIFYVAKFDREVVGYSTYYVKPSLTLGGFRKCAVLYSMAVDKEHRRQGIGRHLLTVSLREMQLNGIYEVALYVSKKNVPALSLYTKLGFAVVGELQDICKEGESCYKMRLGLPTALT